MALEKIRVGGNDAGIHADAEIDPVAHDFAVVINGMQRIFETRVGFVIAAAGAKIADAAGGAAPAVAVRRLAQKRAQALLVDKPRQILDGAPPEKVRP